MMNLMINSDFSEWAHSWNLEFDSWNLEFDSWNLGLKT
jgi:hypothetical protein